MDFDFDVAELFDVGSHYEVKSIGTVSNKPPMLN